MTVDSGDPGFDAVLTASAEWARDTKAGPLAKLARQDPKIFAGLVLRDERTGAAIRLAPHHKAWHDLVTSHKRLLIWAHVEAGKSIQLAVGRVLFEICRDPNLRACVLSNTHGQAVKILRSIAKYVTHSPELKAAFPEIVPGDPWTSGMLTLERSVYSKDPTVQAAGVHGNVLGSRLDFVVVDDILDWENCRTAESRDQLWSWLQATLAGRLTADARLVVIGTALHPEDAMHRWAKLPGFHAVRYPVIDDATGLSRWPERWSMARIAQKRQELGPLEYARQMLCVSHDDAESRFREAWLAVGLKLGDGKDLVSSLPHVPSGCRVFTGVDLAVQQHSAADLTVFFTILVHPSGLREVLCVESGRWAGPEIVSRIIDQHRRFHSIVIVENNAAQDYVLSFTKAVSSVPVKPFTTGRNKAHPEFGVESMAAEIAAGRWSIPNRGGICHPEIEAWLNEMRRYDPRAHTGDRLMSSWFAREGSRMGEGKAGVFQLDMRR